MRRAPAKKLQLMVAAARLRRLRRRSVVTKLAAATVPNIRQKGNTEQCTQETQCSPRLLVGIISLILLMHVVHSTIEEGLEQGMESGFCGVWNATDD